MRVVVERLARRLGYDAVAANIPEEHRKLITHIRKEKSRKLRDDKADKVQPDSLLPSVFRPMLLARMYISLHIGRNMMEPLMFLSSNCLACTQVRVTDLLCMQAATNCVSVVLLVCVTELCFCTTAGASLQC